MELLFQGQLVLADIGQPYRGTGFSLPMALWCLRVTMWFRRCRPLLMP